MFLVCRRSESTKHGAECPTFAIVTLKAAKKKNREYCAFAVTSNLTSYTWPLLHARGITSNALCNREYCTFAVTSTLTTYHMWPLSYACGVTFDTLCDLEYSTFAVTSTLTYVWLQSVHRDFSLSMRTLKSSSFVQWNHCNIHKFLFKLDVK